MSNGWLKLTVFAFVGVLLSVVVLGMTSLSGQTATGDSHTQHQQGSIESSGSVSNNGLDVQSMNANNDMQMNNEFYMIQQQMLQIQNQLNMMQQQMNN
jgi:hypothetical protein